MGNFRSENIDVLFRERDRVNALLDGGPKVVARAAATLRRRWPVAARRDIANDFNLPAREISRHITCTGDASSVTLTAFGRKVSLTKFGARQTRSGVQAEVRKGAPFLIPHAFIATPTGAAAATGPQVFIRNDAPYDVPSDVEDTARIDHDRHGYPILRLAGPGIADMLRDGDREDRLVDIGQQVFAAEIDRLTEVARNG